MAESMALGKTVIGTRYSGNLDFMHDDNSILVDCAMTEIRPSDAAANPGLERIVTMGSAWAKPATSPPSRRRRAVRPRGPRRSRRAPAPRSPPVSGKSCHLIIPGPPDGAARATSALPHGLVSAGVAGTRGRDHRTPAPVDRALSRAPASCSPTTRAAHRRRDSWASRTPRRGTGSRRPPRTRRRLHDDGGDGGCQHQRLLRNRRGLGVVRRDGREGEGQLREEFLRVVELGADEHARQVEATTGRSGRMPQPSLRVPGRPSPP